MAAVAFVSTTPLNSRRGRSRHEAPFELHARAGLGELEGAPFLPFGEFPDAEGVDVDVAAEDLGAEGAVREIAGPGGDAGAVGEEVGAVAGGGRAVFEGPARDDERGVGGGDDGGTGGEGSGGGVDERAGDGVPEAGLAGGIAGGEVAEDFLAGGVGEHREAVDAPFPLDAAAAAAGDLERLGGARKRVEGRLFAVEPGFVGGAVLEVEVEVVHDVDGDVAPVVLGVVASPVVEGARELAVARVFGPMHVRAAVVRAEHVAVVHPGGGFVGHAHLVAGGDDAGVDVGGAVELDPFEDSGAVGERVEVEAWDGRAGRGGEFEIGRFGGEAAVGIDEE